MAMLFYYVQNARGESAAHPNATRLRPADPSRITLADVRDAFPLTGTGSYHFRFQVAQDKALMFLDVTGASDAVPLVGSNVIAKVLHLDAARADGHDAPALRLRSYAGGGARAGRGGEGDASPRAGAGAGAGAGATPAAAAAAAAAVAALMMPAMVSGAPLHVVEKEVDGETHIRDTGDGGDIYRGFKATDARGMRAVKHVAIDPSLVAPPPGDVDADLAGKSDYVKASVMAARADAAAKAGERVAEMAAREAAREALSAARDAARATHEAPLREWGMEAGGKTAKPIRALLATLHTVLWPGARWEPAPMAKLVAPAKVKLFYLKACTIVHPDKVAGLDGEQQFIAGAVFDYLNASFRDFSAAELGCS